MDPLILMDVANSAAKLKMYPYFDICHYILMTTAIRDDTPQSGSPFFSRKHPFSCWFATMLMCFGGVILSNFVCGDPLLTCFEDHVSVFTATAVWYLINYSPFDIVYRFCGFFPIRLLICAMKEIQRAKKIAIGVEHAHDTYPESISTCILIGLLKGSGYLEMKIITRLVRGVWLPASNECLHPSFTTKISLLASIIYYCENIDLIPLQKNLVFLAVVGVFVYLRIAMLVFGFKDPFAPIQNLLCSILFGGVVDALRSALSRKPVDASDESPTKNVVGLTVSPNSSTAGSPNPFSNSQTSAGATNDYSANTSGGGSLFMPTKDGTFKRNVSQSTT